MLQSPKPPGPLYSARFTPIERTVIAVAAVDDGAVLYDIRHFKRFVLQQLLNIFQINCVMCLYGVLLSVYF